MKPFNTKTIFIFSSRSLSIHPFSRPESSRRALYVSHFSSSSSSSHPFQSSSNSAAFRRHEEESRNVRVSVWWDFENCSPSAGGNIFKISHNITAALRASGIKGPIQITAFGDMIQLSRTNQEALSATGINLTHIPHGGKNSADRSLLIDLMYWVSQNPPPSHLLLISGDRDFANTLHRLRMNNYNILLACPENSPSVLCSAASIMWNWNSLVKGDNLSGKYFNQPPDGPYGSWYGYYKVPLEDPFAVNQQPSSSSIQSEDLPDSCQEQKAGPVPKGAGRQIRRILSAYPKGIPITDLRAELSKTEVTLDKDLYGYKKFSKLLLSMPHIKLSGSDGFLYVRIVPQKNCEPAEGPSVSNSDELNLAVSAKGNGKDKKLSISPEVCIEQKEVEPTKEGDTNAVDNKLYTKEKSNCQSELQFLEKLKKKRLGDNEGSRANSTAEETDVRSMNQDIAHQLGPASSSLSDNRKAKDGKVHQLGHASSSLSDNGKAKDGKVSEPGFFKKFIGWFKFWRTDPSTDILSEDSGKIPKEVAVDQVNIKLFSDDTFWTEMERFLNTSHGSDIVLRSKSREDMAENLQKEGPSILTPLSTSDLLHLLHLMITEKKCVKECIRQPYPFKLAKPVKHSSLNTSSSNGLSLIFTSPANESESDVANEKQDNKKFSETSRNEMLADCQKLADEIVNEYPDGFNMGSFRRLFFQRFGYPLDFQNLGYQKLATLLQIMPGVKVEANFIYPSTKNTNGESSDSLKKDSNDLDSQWEELGPVAAKDNQPNDDYDPMTDELISDSDEETKSSSLAKSDEKSGKMCSSSLNKEDSSLIRILDSWYSKNGDIGKGSGAESVEENVDGSSKDVTFLGGNSGKKQRPTKTYSFVSDKDNENGSRDKLIDGILGSLKKSGESRLHS